MAQWRRGKHSGRPKYWVSPRETSAIRRHVVVISDFKLESVSVVFSLLVCVRVVRKFLVGNDSMLLTQPHLTIPKKASYRGWMSARLFRVSAFRWVMHTSCGWQSHWLHFNENSLGFFPAGIQWQELSRRTHTTLYPNRKKTCPIREQVAKRMAEKMLRNPKWTAWTCFIMAPKKLLSRKGLKYSIQAIVLICRKR